VSLVRFLEAPPQKSLEDIVFEAFLVFGAKVQSGLFDLLQATNSEVVLIT